MTYSRFYITFVQCFELLSDHEAHKFDLIHCKVQMFVIKFTSQFVNKAFDWLLLIYVDFSSYIMLPNNK
jgi:hypothetical protein